MSAYDKYRLDKTAFKIQSYEQADDHFTPWINKTPNERMDAAWYLICHAFCVKPTTKLDRTVFSKRKHE